MTTLERGKYYVTVPGADRLKNELEALEGRRGELAANIRTAKAYGDLSENFEYHEAKREQGLVEGRIQQLRIIIPSMAVVAPEDVDTQTVGFGSVVTLEEEGETWDCTVLGPLEADPSEDRVSHESPLGSALMGRKVGDVVETDVPAGRVRYTITGIRPYEIR